MTDTQKQDRIGEMMREYREESRRQAHAASKVRESERDQQAALIASQARRIAELEAGDEAEQLRETGWVIERGNSQPSTPTYWAGPDRWSQDHMDAVRFTRQIDAARVASRETWLAPHRVCEHVWISTGAALKGETP